MRLLILLLTVIALAGASLTLWAQDQGPIGPPPTLEVNRVPSVPHPGPPPIPEQQIIQRFAANEDAMQKAFDTYIYTQTVRFEEETDPAGMLTATGDTYFKADGQRYWRLTKEPHPTLTATYYTLSDVMDMAAIPYFFLTTADVGNYTFLYSGQQQLDQINTYTFQVKPKVLSRKQRYFEGVIWVDDHDYAIVRSWGKFVLEVEPESEKRPFTMFETYRENFENKYWLPTYTAAEGDVTQTDGSKLGVKLVIRDTEFKHRADSAAPPDAPQASGSSGASSTASPAATSSPSSQPSPSQAAPATH